MLALKTDGSIWKWRIDNQEGAEFVRLSEPPVRLGTHHDWVALGCWGYENVALAADGTLWNWPATDWPARYYRGMEPAPWLAPSRRPAIIENILDPPL